MAPRWRRIALLLVAGAAAIAVLYLVAVHTAFGQRVDDAAVLRHNLDRLADRDVHNADVVLLALAIALVPVAALAGRRQPLRAALGLIGALGAVAVARVVQSLLPRPDLVVFNPLYSASYPSGHAAGAMGVALALRLVGPPRAWARWLAVAGPASVGGLALAFPIHRPSDILAGFAIALAGLGTVALLWPAAPPAPPRDGGRQLIEAALRVVIITAVLLLAETLVLTRTSGLGLGDLGPAFILGIITVTAAAEATTTAFARLARP